MPCNRDGHIRGYKFVINNFGRFSSTAEDHAKLDVDTKKSVLKAASSVVCLISYSGDKQLFISSGFIMECEHRCGTFMATILSSATSLQCPSGVAKVADDIKIVVYKAGGTLFEGKVLAVDFHYNVAMIMINSDAPLPASIIRFIDVSLSLDPNEPGCIEDPKSSQFAGHQDSASSSNRFSLHPGEEVFALGRYFADSYDIMVAPGKFSFGDCSFDCKELLSASCNIKKNGVGGPLINCFGEVIGINFYDASYTPFLPINIAYKCFGDLKKQRQIPRPWIGLSVIDLYLESLYELEKLNQHFPHVVKGAVVKQVLPNSPAFIAGLHVGDVIIDCNGSVVGSCLELTEELWEKEAKPVELVVVRAVTGKQLNLIVKAVKTNPKEYQWPVPKPRILYKHPLMVATPY